jgi:hypothetical protein
MKVNSIIATANISIIQVMTDLTTPVCFFITYYLKKYSQQVTAQGDFIPTAPAESAAVTAGISHSVKLKTYFYS